MSGRDILKGAADIFSIVRILDAADGSPELGVTAATPGLAFNFIREGGLVAAISAAALDDMTALDDAHVDGELKHIFAGYYRLAVRDAAFAAGSDGVLIGGVATGMVVVGTYHALTDFPIYSSPVIQAIVKATPSPTVTVFTIDRRVDETDALKGAIIEFDKGSTLEGQKALITASAPGAGDTAITVATGELTKAPVSGDIITIP